jgi:hypothetical protein
VSRDTFRIVIENERTTAIARMFDKIPASTVDSVLRFIDANAARMRAARRLKDTIEDIAEIFAPVPPARSGPRLVRGKR